VARTLGKAAALEQAERLKLTGNPYYWALLGELYTGIDNRRARECYQEAVSLAKSEAERVALVKKIDGLWNGV
jgi:predicted RNA polymerase sigma factor